MRRAALFLGLLLTACGGGSDSTTAPVTNPPVVTPVVAAVATVTITSPTSQLLPSVTTQLLAVVKDANGVELTGRTVTWSVSASSVLSMNGTDLVIAVGPGLANVSATSEGKSANTAIAVGVVNSGTSAGGTVIAAGGKVQLAFPSGAVTANTQISVTPIVNPLTTALTIPGTAYEFGLSGSFAASVDAAIKYDVSQLQGSIDQSKLRLNTLTAGTWQISPNSFVDAVAHVVHGPLNHFSLYIVCQFPCYPDAARLDLSLTGITTIAVKQVASKTFVATL